jgi:glycosyltransferase involved in cell wall biosynthesis
MRHGGNLRWLSLSRELLLRGHRVYFCINRHPGDELAARREYLNELQGQRVLSGYFEFDYSLPPTLSKLAHALAYPPLTSFCLRARQAPVLVAIRAFIAQKHIDVVLLSARSLLFTVPALGRDVPVVVDWVDSFVLYNRRHLGRALRTADVRALPAICRDLLAHYFQERYYTKHAGASLTVSPVDKACVDAVSGVPGKVHAVLNGSDVQRLASVPRRAPNRLIFTGNMSFPPNHEAAVWFLDHVFPLVLARRPDLVFAVAGRNPRPELMARARPNVLVLGAVEDLRREIAKSALYVAPLISGGGFKNKILEALGTGTYVVGTPLAVEFLPDTVKCLLRVADEPEALAQQILDFLADPRAFDGELERLTAVLSADFTWAGRAEQLLAILADLLPPAAPSTTAVHQNS